jgi:Chagasin family peptidase inhibitor I42
VDDLPSELTIPVGESRRFRLPGLAQAGYRWKASVESGGEAVDVATGFDDAQKPEVVPGKPFAGEFVSIHGRAPGRATIRLAQARSWEPENAGVAERTLDITVVNRAS